MTGIASAKSAGKTITVNLAGITFNGKANSTAKAKVGDSLKFVWKNGVHNVVSSAVPSGAKKVNSGAPTAEARTADGRAHEEGHLLVLLRASQGARHDDEGHGLVDRDPTRGPRRQRRRGPRSFRPDFRAWRAADGGFTITPKGVFSLDQAGSFGFGPREAESGGAMRLCFAADGSGSATGVVLREADDGTITGEVHGDTPVDDARAQVARILSLEHDGEAWEQVGSARPGHRRACRPASAACVPCSSTRPTRQRPGP